MRTRLDVHGPRLQSSFEQSLNPESATDIIFNSIQITQSVLGSNREKLAQYLDVSSHKHPNHYFVQNAIRGDFRGELDFSFNEGLS